MHIIHFLYGITFVVFFYLIRFSENYNYFLETLISIPSLFYVIPLFSLAIVHKLLNHKETATYLFIFSLIWFLFGSELIINLNRQNIEDLKISENEIKVVQWNIRGWDEELLDTFPDYLKELNADLYLLQEAQIPYFLNASEYVSLLKEQFNGYYIAQNNEFLTVSRYPISSFGVAKENGFQKTEINIKGEEFIVLNAHILAPFVNPLYFPYENFFEKREAQFKELYKEINSSNSELIVAGDFNSLPHHPHIRKMKSILKQNNPNKNISFPRTFATYLPLIRIDYLFSNLDNSFLEYTALKAEYRQIDHFGIVSKVSY